MPRDKNTVFENYVLSEGDGEPAPLRANHTQDVFLAAIAPSQDFLPGAMLAGYPEALRASQRAVEEDVAKLDGSARLSWEGTKASVRSKDGDIVDRIEIHGASYNRDHDEAIGVRCDLTGLKLSL